MKYVEGSARPFYWHRPGNMSCRALDNGDVGGNFGTCEVLFVVVVVVVVVVILILLVASVLLVSS